MNLIANTGIQLFTIPLEINLNENFKMYFYEWRDTENEKLTLEIAHKFSDSGDDIWVKKSDLGEAGKLVDGEVVRWEDKKPYKWEEIKDEFLSEGYKPIDPSEIDRNNCFQVTLGNCNWEKFENHWLPFPFFQVRGNGKSEFGPINWCRFKLIPDASSVGNVKKYNLLLAFDTQAIYEAEGYEEEDLQEKPVFVNEDSKDFALCDNEFLLIDFLTKHTYKDSAKEIDCEWVDEAWLKHFHNCTKEEFERKDLKPKMKYMAQFVFFNRYIQHELKVLPKITLFSDKDVEIGLVDLLVDMGNSRTCAVLFDDSNFTKVNPLGLQNFFRPLKNGELNRHDDPFDMRLAFHEANFGGNLKKGSSQFTYPSMVRLGIEANELIHYAENSKTGVEKVTTFSSPKRFLWDSKPQKKEWEFVTLPGEQSKLVRIKGVSEYLNFDGSLNTEGIGGIDKCYSRKALMTFCFLEILAQAKMQINSYEYRKERGGEYKPRKIGRIIVTCPTAMSRVEQIALRKCAEDATAILETFYKETYNKVQVIPSVKNLKKTDERNEWLYDEATCTQFVYLYAEIAKRYRNNCKEYFDFYGKKRNDLNDYNKNSLTIGSVDIGAGTTDVMIATYKYDDTRICKLTPVPLFWESFYIAGDDLLKSLVRELVIEGKNAVIHKHLIARNANNIPEKIHDFFDPDNARQDITRRKIRSEFNLQVSVPMVQHFLELLRSENKIEKATLTFNDIFENNKPTKEVLEHFKKHFDFGIEDLQYSYDKEIVSKIVESTFDALVAKISTILSYYGCDIVLLSGRPNSLKPLTDLFLKYYAVSPNRLITLNNYRIGTWYPFHDGNGYFEDAKSIVAVGAMIGHCAAARGGLDGFLLDLSELIKKMLPTTEYFAKAEKENSFIEPQLNNAKIDVSLQKSLRIWTRQLNSKSYPTRPFYMLDFNREKIEEKIKSKFGLEDKNKAEIQIKVNNEIDRLKKLSPYNFSIIRENYMEDKETLKIESVEDCNREDLPSAFFSLQVQSMSEDENYWLDSGEFLNLNPR